MQPAVDPRVEKLLSGFEDASFRTFPKQERDKVRWLHDPNESMREAHELIKELAANASAISPHATGLQGGSRANAERHLGNKFFYLIDLKDAYGQIQLPALAEFLGNHGFPAETADIETILNRFCRKPDGQGLCQGGPASPLLFNIALYDVDQQIAGICEKHELTYTRYADDLAISGRESIGDKKRKQIRGVLEEAGLEISHKKTHRHSLANAPVVVTGIQINRSGSIILPTPKQLRVANIINELCFQVFEDGEPLTELQVQKVAGYKGMVMSAIDGRRKDLTAFEKDALVKAEALRLSYKQSRETVNLGFTALRLFNGRPMQIEIVDGRFRRVVGPSFELPKRD